MRLLDRNTAEIRCTNCGSFTDWVRSKDFLTCECGNGPVYDWVNQELLGLHLENEFAGYVGHGWSESETLARMLSSNFGNEVWDDSAEVTASRILRFWQEYAPKPMDFKVTTFKAEVQQLILVRDIAFSSLCCHHLLPFYGKAHVGYLPHELQVGVSKIPRVVQHFAKRPSVQERLTSEIADFFKSELHAKAVGVVVEATHTCMACRGIRAMGSSMVTSEMRGIFLTSDRPRAEFLELIR